MKYFKYVERDRTWPGMYQLTDNPEFVCGWDGEEGVYFDDLEFLKFLDEKYEEYLQQKQKRTIMGCSCRGAEDPDFDEAP